MKTNWKIPHKNVINFVKICSNCFFIYNFLQNYLESIEKKSLSQSNFHWIHREKKFVNTFNESLKLKFSENENKKSNTSPKKSKDQFLKKQQDYTSQILNLGFTTSFRSNLKHSLTQRKEISPPLKIEESMCMSPNSKMKKIDLYQGLALTSNRKKTVMSYYEDVKNNEIGRRSSVFFSIHIKIINL